MNITSRRIAAVVVLVLVAITTFVPVAVAARPDDQPTHGVGAIAGTTSALPFERAALRGQATPAPRPDDRAGSRGPGIFTSSPSLTSSVARSFVWEDAALGAGSMLALCCLVAFAGLAVTRQRRKMVLS